MLLYALLHLFGYDLSLDDLKAFRVSGRSLLLGLLLLMKIYFLRP